MIVLAKVPNKKGHKKIETYANLLKSSCRSYFSQ